ncbi:hypothetical protein SCHPADRAFT_438077 [Schizopora paradoxa]|uniref:Uncharacterized protein n=1 Tax=Schizopora paradoxa TaxID=27342 RepID=A0A0H2RKE9_9AGAM|nr:hypothetical protein SCHPADRAFT_438077 [Schizopora paradoxa]
MLIFLHTLRTFCHVFWRQMDDCCRVADTVSFTLEVQLRNLQFNRVRARRRYFMQMRAHFGPRVSNRVALQRAFLQDNSQMLSGEGRRGRSVAFCLLHVNAVT